MATQQKKITPHSIYKWALRFLPMFLLGSMLIEKLLRTRRKEARCIECKCVLARSEFIRNSVGLFGIYCVDILRWVVGAN